MNQGMVIVLIVVTTLGVADAGGVSTGWRRQHLLIMLTVLSIVAGVGKPLLMPGS